MGSFNILEADLLCPRCKVTATMEIEFKFGSPDLTRYHLGDKLTWGRSKLEKKLASYTSDPVVAEGYVQCPECNKDFFVKITMHQGVLEHVEWDATRPPYIP